MLGFIVFFSIYTDILILWQLYWLLRIERTCHQYPSFWWLLTAEFHPNFEEAMCDKPDFNRDVNQVRHQNPIKSTGDMETNDDWPQFLV